MRPICSDAARGHRSQKKDLGLLAMQYGDVYVASVALEANPAQLVTAMKEAEAYPGPSLIVAYAPCIAHGSMIFNTPDRTRMAVDTGWVLPAPVRLPQPPE
jgi:pyruvate-ferredoxin/flavodoxin oxidoreductase